MDSVFFCSVNTRKLGNESTFRYPWMAYENGRGGESHRDDFLRGFIRRPTNHIWMIGVSDYWVRMYFKFQVHCIDYVDISATIHFRRSIFCDLLSNSPERLFRKG